MTRKSKMVCVVVGCGSKSDTAKGIGMFRISSIIKNQGEEMEELTTLRREKWISAISRDDTMHKNVLQSERVCGRHFVSGRPSQHWDKHNVDWIPTLNLGKKEYRERNPKERKLVGKVPLNNRNASLRRSVNFSMKVAHGLLLSIFLRMQQVLRTKMLIPRKPKM